MRYSLEVVRRVYDDQDGVYLEVGPSPDNTEWVEVRAVDDTSKKYYGDIRFAIMPDQARLLGESLIAASNEASQKKI